MKCSQHIRQGEYFTHFNCNPNNYGRALMSGPPQAIAPNPHTSRENDDVRSEGILLHITVPFLPCIQHSLGTIWLSGTHELRLLKLN
jgi:hypothetical protein